MTYDIIQQQLQAALLREDVDQVRDLLVRRADPATKHYTHVDHQELSAYERYPLGKGNIPLLKSLITIPQELTYYRPGQALDDFIASVFAQGSKEEVVAMFELGYTDLRLQLTWGADSLLHHFMTNRNPGVVNLLVDKQLAFEYDVHLVNDDGQTAAFDAVWTGNTVGLAFLKQCGLNCLKVDDFRGNAYHDSEVIWQRALNKLIHLASGQTGNWLIARTIIDYLDPQTLSNLSGESA